MKGGYGLSIRRDRTDFFFFFFFFFFKNVNVFIFASRERPLLLRFDASGQIIKEVEFVEHNGF